MTTFLDVFVRAIFAENLALSYLLGMCTFLAVSRRVSTALGLGLAVVVVEAVTVPLNNLAFTHLLTPGALEWAGLGEVDLRFLKLIMFIGLIAALIQVLEMVLERFAPRLQAALGIYLPLLAVNCAILGASLFMAQRNYGFVESVAYGLGAGCGWALALLAFAAIRERLRYSDVPDGLRGIGLAFMVAGLLSLGFSGLAGLGV
jgi:Na+-transporting NADH:ubiquinone oxidoreductase subunit E